MKIVDLHADSINRMHREFKLSDYEEIVRFFTQSSMHIDYQKLIQGNYLMQTFALWSQEKDQRAALNDFEAQLYILNTIMDHFSTEITLIKSAKDLLSCVNNQGLHALLSIEDIGPFGGSGDLLQHYYDLGARMMSLTWNHENAYGYPNGPVYDQKGLKRPGYEAIEMMDSLGVVIDISHLSDRGTLDVISHAKKPLIASHSNARSICAHPRNLTDPMIKALANKGGVMGINFFSLFVDGTTNEKSNILEGLMRHLHHIIKVGGIDTAALGTDFDGMPLNDQHISDCGHIQGFVDYLQYSGFTSNQIEAVCFKNAIRVLKDNL